MNQIRKVDLKMNESLKYEIIKKLVETNGNKNSAAVRLGCSRRHINRMVKGYIAQGKAFFSHGNRGIKPKHSLDLDIANRIVSLYSSKYIHSNFQHYSELLSKHEDIHVSVSTVRNLLTKAGFISPRATRATKKRARKELVKLKENAHSTTDIRSIEERILNLDEDAHPRRPRCAYFGEMLQMDASVHNWFGTEKTHLHIAIDDATNRIVGAYFDVQETLNGYYNVFHQILSTYGIPYMFFTDRRTVFEYKQKKSTSIEADTYTQFSYACKQLGVEIKTSSVPQAKGRVERLFQTLQSRLPIELKLAGVDTVGKANAFLNSYIKEYNSMFSCDLNNIKSVFEKQPNEENINLILAVLTERRIDKGNCLKFENKYYLPKDSNGLPLYFNYKTRALVIQAFDGNLFATINDTVVCLDEVPQHEEVSRNFDFKQPPTEQKKRAIPKMNHPWRRNAFVEYANSQQHKMDISFMDIAHSQENFY